jgi:AraC family transcriptional regulator, transcriptional activator FtrA
MAAEVTTSRNRSRHVVAVPVAPGSPVFEVAVPCEVFGVDRTDITPDWYELVLCRTGPAPSALPHGLELTGGGSLADVAAADTVVVPAWQDLDADPPADLLDALRTAHARGARIASVCTGAFVLAAAGLLDGRRATTHWRHAEELAARYPLVDVDAGVLYTEDGTVFTSAGTAAGLDLCLHLVRADHGARVAAEVARRLVVPPHRDGGQAQYIRSPLAPPGADADAISRVMGWALQHLDRPMTVTALARHAAMSPRTFARAFAAATGTTPAHWLTRRRIDAAKELLETTDLTVDQVADRVGFGSAVTLRARFAQVTGVAPSRYRRTFAGRVPSVG